MLNMTANDIFEDDDEFFADVFRSISEIESSSTKSVSSETHANQNTCEIDNFSPMSSNNISSMIVMPESCKQRVSTLNTYDTNENSYLSAASDDMELEESMVSKIDFDESEILSVINSRFRPEFTPKVKKRKFVGPAGNFTEKESLGEESSDNIEPILKRPSLGELEIQTVTNSQFFSEELLQSLSWQKLQDDVSSNSNLLSIAKYYSINRVLKETAKKKLPKHIVVPVLCVCIKLFNPDDLLSEFIDDTGEINGKVDKEIIMLYKDYLRKGTALLLKRVSFMCNVMILEKANLTSIYLGDGTVLHVQDLNAPTEKEPLKPLNCICTETPKSANREASLAKLKNSVIDREKKSTNKSFSSLNIHQLPDTSENSLHCLLTEVNSESRLSNLPDNSTSSDAVLENDEMDEFDEFLGNLDEKSFLEDF